MTTVPDILKSRPLLSIHAHRSVLLPIAVMGLFLVILVPLPTAVMDFLLLINITLSGIVMLTVMYIEGPLAFSSFPSLLLGMTLFRLVLAVATTRLVLTQGYAGAVVATFGNFVAGGSLAVGVVIFAIIVIIQFVVITKGATRIAEVAARFTLDGMPGKQMAVDADLNAGTITDEDARRRRSEITREADFYGAMDGASKFVRGDAIAGVIIILVNILGGIFVGLVQMGLPISETLRRFTILTIGDGLVSQIPAFIVSVAAAMIVTRSAEKKNLGEELLGQLVSQPVALGLTGAFLFTLGLTPLPKLPLLSLAGSSVVISYFLRQKSQIAVAQTAAAKTKAAPAEKVEKHLSPDPMELNVGYGLIRLVDRKQGGDLLDRITNLRRQIAQEIGIIVPPIRIRDEIQLEPNQFQVNLKGLKIGLADVLPGQLLAIDSGTVTDRVRGVETKEPAFGLSAIWIDAGQRHDAEHRNYTVVEPTSVISTYLAELIRRHADELLTRQEVNRLLDHLKETSAKLVEEVVPSVLKPGEIQRVLQGLLKERVPIRDLESILEAIADIAPRTKDTEILTEYARNALARTLCNLHKADDGRIHCITLDPGIEQLVAKNIERSDRGSTLTLAPSLQSRIVEAIRAQLAKASTETRGKLPVMLTPPQVRIWIRKMLEVQAPNVAVLAYNEIARGFEVESHGMVVLNDEA
ncbi:MAG: flagellar biosynthesis protein FlhA [Planctomycetes bacterium]|nr:flagellar biosynthesis protein FlhA [Planctomycetota bacterium]MBI3835287.1 flagellar biosynthesis protein FlhA [Planctomycetota bacterium]